MLWTRWLTVCLLGAVVGCAQPRWPMEPPQKPDPAPEMARLQRFVGEWSFTWEMVSPSPEAMKVAMPEGEEPMPTTFKGKGRNELVLGGMFLKGQGTYEVGEGQKITYVEYWTWDRKAGKYRSFFFSDWGEYGQGWGTFKDENTMHMKFRGADAEGNTKTGEGTQTFIDDNTAEFTFTERGPMGTMKFKGTATRVR